MKKLEVRSENFNLTVNMCQCGTTNPLVKEHQVECGCLCDFMNPGEDEQLLTHSYVQIP